MLISDNEKSQNDIRRVENKWLRDKGTFESLSVFNVEKSTCANRYISFQFKLVMRYAHIDHQYIPELSTSTYITTCALSAMKPAKHWSCE